jgi:hypothetical protein
MLLGPLASPCSPHYPTLQTKCYNAEYKIHDMTYFQHAREMGTCPLIQHHHTCNIIFELVIHVLINDKGMWNSFEPHYP